MRLIILSYNCVFGIAILFCFFSCNNTKSSTASVENKKATLFSKPRSAVFINDSVGDYTQKTLRIDTVIFYDDESQVNPQNSGFNQSIYAVIADTDDDYRALYKKILTIRKTLNIKIDLGAQYHKDGKGSIKLSKNTGYSLTRIYNSDFMSIESLSTYEPNFKDRKKEMLCIIASIFAQKSSADSLADIIRPVAPNVFVTGIINHFM